MQTQNYYGFNDWADVASQFSAEIGPVPELVYAVYSTPAYEGSADVVFRRNDEWFHGSGGHCSCYGLKGQWEPEVIDPTDHIKAVAEGKRVLLVSDSEGDYPEATQENFNAWLAWAAAQP